MFRRGQWNITTGSGCLCLDGVSVEHNSWVRLFVFRRGQWNITTGSGCLCLDGVSGTLQLGQAVCV